jgi:copper homeostasis protein CutC
VILGVLDFLGDLDLLDRLLHASFDRLLDDLLHRVLDVTAFPLVLEAVARAEHREILTSGASPFQHSAALIYGRLAQAEQPHPVALPPTASTAGTCAMITGAIQSE